MLGHKAGDNSQIMALAEALGWPYESKHLVYKKTELLTNLLSGPTLAGLVKEKSNPLAPPWPELIISAGRRNEPLVRWIQQQAGGPGKVRLVHVGRPWARHECFDLIVTTPQYRLPDKPNILHNEAPLHRITRQRLSDEAAKWQPRLAHLPEPRVTVILGGNAGPYNFDRENGALLGYWANRRAAELSGSLLVTTSARTPVKAIDALEAELEVPNLVYRWRPNDQDNPYFAFLGLASEIIVTGDSMSMLAESIVSGRPVQIFDLARGTGSQRPPLPADGHLGRRSLKERLRDLRPGALVYRAGMVTGPRRLTRDVGIIHRRQVEAGRATWLGQPAKPPSTQPLLDVERAAAAVRHLFTSAYEPPSTVPRGSPLFGELFARLFQ